MAIAVNVTAADIQSGRVRDPEACPAALALSRAMGGRPARVGKITMAVIRENDVIVWRTPDEVAEFIGFFEQHWNVGPFTFWVQEPTPIPLPVPGDEYPSLPTAVRAFLLTLMDNHFSRVEVTRLSIVNEIHVRVQVAFSVIHVVFTKEAKGWRPAREFQVTNSAGKRETIEGGLAAVLHSLAGVPIQAEETGTE